MSTFQLPPLQLPTNTLPYRTMDPGDLIRTKDARKMDPDFLESLAEDARKMLEITKGLFSGGVAVTGAHEPDKVDDAVKFTRGLVEDKNIPAIFSGAFYMHGKSDAVVNQGLMVRPEILERLTDGSFRLIEATSSTRAEKKHYIPLAAKMQLLQQLGIPVTQASLVLVNSAYDYQGGEPDMTQLLKMEDCTEKLADADIAAQAAKFIEETKELLARGVSNTDEIPEEKVPLYDISRLIKADVKGNQHYTKTKKIMAYAAANGITDLRNLPTDLSDDVLPLSVLQRRQIEVLKTGKSYVDREGLRAALSKIKFPAYHMDFETTQEIVPPFPGVKPYQQLPYQYSVHPMGKDGVVPGDENRVYLFNGQGDPRRGFIEKLIVDVGADKNEDGSIIVCFAHFERNRLEEIAEALPEYKEKIDNIISRLVDIQDIVRQNVYVAEFDASFSLKKIFPGLVKNPRTRYEDLTIHNGAMASQAIGEMISPATSRERSEQIYKNLLLYCGLDTFSMVEIYNVLVKLANGEELAAA